MSKKILSTTALVDCLVYNNRFANRKITAEQIGAENFAEWKTLISDLHRVAFTAYVYCENNNLQVEDCDVDLNPVFNAMRNILSEFGEINGHKIYANKPLVTLIVGYSGKRANKDSTDLGFCLSQLRNRSKELAEAEKSNGINPDYITNLRNEIDKLTEKKNELLNKPDNRIKEPTRTSADAFRLEIEHRLARLIAEQQAKSWEELEEQERVKKEARKNNKKAKKSATKKA